MSDKVIYFNTDTEKVVGAYGGAQLLTNYSIAYKAQPIWEIHFITVSEDGAYIPTDLSKATAWRAAVDIDFNANTDPMIRTLPSGINSDSAASGILNVELNADTQNFLDKVNGKESVAGKFEIRGTSSEGKTVYSYRFSVNCLGAVDALGATPLPVASGGVSQDWVLGVLRAGRELQFSVDGLSGWHDTQDEQSDLYYRERYPSGEWSQAIYFKYEQIPLLKTQFCPTISGTYHDEPSAGDSYIRFSRDDGETWTNGLYVKGIDGTNGVDGEDGEDGTDGIGFTFTGLYSNSTTYYPASAYNAYMITQYQGSSWVYVGDTSSVGNPPPSSADGESDVWWLVAAKGTGGGSSGGLTEVYASDVIGLSSYITNIAYTKTDINTNYYTSGTVQTLLNQKAFTSGVYTKSESDTLLNKKAFTSGVYTKTQIDTKISNIGSNSLVPLSTYNSDMNLINTSLNNMEDDLDGKLSKTTVYDIGTINSALSVDGNRGDYQTCTIAADSTVVIGQTSFYNFTVGDGVALQITKEASGSVLVVNGNIVLDSNTSGIYMIGVFRNNTKYMITAPTQVIG